MPFKILLVERSPVMRRVLERAIRIPGIPEASCISAEDGQTAARLLEARDVDLILMDTNTFTADEENLLQRVRGNASLQHIGCIVLSADATATRVQSTLDLGATAYLTKPVAAGVLRAEITRNLDTSHADN